MIFQFVTSAHSVSFSGCSPNSMLVFLWFQTSQVHLRTSRSRRWRRTASPWPGPHRRTMAGPRWRAITWNAARLTSAAGTAPPPPLTLNWRSPAWRKVKLTTSRSQPRMRSAKANTPRPTNPSRRRASSVSMNSACSNACWQRCRFFSRPRFCTKPQSNFHFVPQQSDLICSWLGGTSYLWQLKI